MNLVWKGRYKSIDQLPVGNLPDNAVKFKEPGTLAKTNLVVMIFIIPILLIVALAVYTKASIGGSIDPLNIFNIWGLILAFLMVVPHELIHAAVFPKEAEVEVWFSLKNMMAFVVSTHPMSKSRFIFLCLLPNIIFGFIPLIIWIFLPNDIGSISQIVFTFAFCSIGMGAGDYLNVFNASIQMPKGSMTQLSGFNSYWYMPGSKKDNK